MTRHCLFLTAIITASTGCNEETADVSGSLSEAVTITESEPGNRVASETDSPLSNPDSEAAIPLNLEYQPDALKSEDYLQANENLDVRSSMKPEVEKYPDLFDKKNKKGEKNITVKPLLSEERDPNLDLSIKSLKESVSGAEVNIRKDID